MDYNSNGVLDALEVEVISFYFKPMSTTCWPCICLGTITAGYLHSREMKCCCTAGQVAVLNLYNVVNKRLPGWQDPPTRARIKAALLEYDYNKDSVLNQEVCRQCLTRSDGEGLTLFPQK